MLSQIRVSYKELAEHDITQDDKKVLALMKVALHSLCVLMMGIWQ